MEEVWEWIKNDPMLLAAVLGTAAFVGAGLRTVYSAAVGAAVRTLDKVAPAHKGDEDELIEAVRAHDDSTTMRGKVDSLATTWVPKSVIREAVKRRHDSIAPAYKSEDPPPD